MKNYINKIQGKMKLGPEFSIWAASLLGAFAVQEEVVENLRS